MLRMISILGLFVMAAGILGLFWSGSLFTEQPLAIVFQAVAVVLLISARLSFGRRSFHASASPTAGGLVTSGPYRYIRHPIYTAACLFGWAGVASHWSPRSVGWGALLLLGSVTRMLCEERLVQQAYPEYREYAKATKRMIPYLF